MHALDVKMCVREERKGENGSVKCVVCFQVLDSVREERKKDKE